MFNKMPTTWQALKCYYYVNVIKNSAISTQRRKGGSDLFYRVKSETDLLGRYPFKDKNKSV